MRYLLFIFVIFFQSNFVFADYIPNCNPSAFSGSHCNGVLVPGVVAPNYGYCQPHPSTEGFYQFCRTTRCPSPLINNPASPLTCICPEGQTEYILDPSGTSKMCGPICVAPQISNIVTSGGQTTVSCIDPPDSSSGQCQDSEKVYDPVTGLLVCPGSGDGPSSSATSSQSCVVPGDYNGDCIEDSQQGSSANNSNPASSPNTSSPNTSSPSTGGGDDDGENPSTGGGGGGGGSGGASGSASATSSASGGSNGSGSNSSWTPVSGYGNWIPVNPNSPCPNKYQDKDGQWWCWGGQSNSAASNSAGSAGSATSASNSSSPYGGGGECDDEPVCPEGDIECLQFIQQWHTRCGGEKIDSKFFEMEDQGDAEASFSKSFTNFKTELEKLPNTQHIQNFFQFNASGSCPVWQVSVWVFDVVIDQQCSSDIPWDLIAGVIIAVSVLLAARIALT